MAETRIPPFYQRYISLVDSNVLVHTLQQNGESFYRFANGWTDEMINHRYAPEKWSARELIQHLTDSERVFSYRALRFARQDQTILPGFDENSYARLYGEDTRSFTEVLQEMQTVRAATISLFGSFTPLQLKRTGTASGVTMSVRTIGEVIAGHELHHWNILIERYFPDKG